jgi:hypothetical protein
MSIINRVSLTGVDDRIDVSVLSELSREFLFVEWGILYVPHKLGSPRNPSKAWYSSFFESNRIKWKFSAIHLCGSLAFNELLDNTLPKFISLADRIQLNINARKIEFTDKEVLEVYERSLDLGPDIILQYNENTAENILHFISCLDKYDMMRVGILLDESRGRGTVPEIWSIPEKVKSLLSEYKDVSCGFAGGINPDNIVTVMQNIETMIGDKDDDIDFRWWIDMESGIRTDNEFDLVKAEHILTAV